MGGDYLTGMNAGICVRSRALQEDGVQGPFCTFLRLPHKRWLIISDVCNGLGYIAASAGVHIRQRMMEVVVYIRCILVDGVGDADVWIESSLICR